MGVGMGPDILAQAFQAFFTTKLMGQGTGLGLSMVYGFARQSNGYARRSTVEPGHGTTVRLWLLLEFNHADLGRSIGLDAMRRSRPRMTVKSFWWSRTMPRSAARSWRC